MRYTLFFWIGWGMLPLLGQNRGDIPSFVEKEKARAAAMIYGRSAALTDNYDWQYQRLELRLDPRFHYVEGNTTVYFAFRTPSRRMEMDLASELEITSVTYRGAPLDFTHTADDRLIIRFPGELPAGRTDSVRIAYRGVPPSTGFSSFTTATHRGVPILWTLSEPYGAKDWWPCKQDLTDKLDSVEITLVYPARISGKEMKGVSNGILEEEYTAGNLRISRWKHRYPIPAYLVAVAITNYARFSQTAGLYESFPINNYVFPEDSARAVARTAVVRDLMDFYETAYGPYPFRREKYGHAQFGWGGGMEHTTITFVGGFSRGLLSHELAHHWFGDYVTCGSWSDIWINEGFATYSEALTQEYFDGPEALYFWRLYALEFIRRRPHESVYVEGRDTLDVGRLFSWELSYLKGAMVLHMLRFRTGDDLFFDILRTFADTYAFDYARTEDFRQIVEALTGEDYGEFFRDWVYGKGYPELEGRWWAVSGTTYKISLFQHPTDASVTFFETPIVLRFTSPEGTYDTIVDWQSDGQTWFVTLPFRATELALDPDFHLIRGEARTYFEGNIRWGDWDVRLFPNPAASGIYVMSSRPEEYDGTAVFDLSGRLIARHGGPNTYFSLEGLAGGVYVIVLYKDGQRMRAFKFIKQP
ncbi:MAG: M1 family metallopeptidase [Chlorobi bacterium]|nr:M1 family metallopeptidase [Chlorobiota bacterium]